MTDGLRKDVWVLKATEQADAVEQYRRACAQLFDVTLLSPEAEFHNSLEGYNLGGVLFARCIGVPQRFERKLSHIMADSADLVMLVLDLEPTTWRGNYDGREASSDQGEIRLIDLSRPYDASTQAYRTLYMAMPRTLLDPQAAQLDFHGRVASKTSPTGHLLAAHLHALWDALETMASAEAAMGAKAASALLSGVILAHAEPGAAEARPVEKMLLALARQFIDKNLEDLDLQPETVRNHLAVSRSLLYRVFEPTGGVSAFIQARRLDRAFDTILQDRTEQQTLAEISYRHGFRSDAHFSRAFRARFGVAPGRLRRLGESARQEGLSALERPDDVWAWLRGL